MAKHKWNMKHLALLLCVRGASALHAGAVPLTMGQGAAARCTPVVMEKGRESEDVAGAVANTFGDIFANMFKPNAEKEAAIDRAYAEQLEVAELRRNPEAYRRKLRKTEERRARVSEEFAESIAWQRGSNPLADFLERKKQGKVKKLGYEDEPTGGIPLPSASFGVGGEFGVGGKYDNGQRFDLRLPFVDQGWVDESSTLTRKSYAKKGAKGKAAAEVAAEPKRNWWEPKAAADAAATPSGVKARATKKGGGPVEEEEPSTPKNPLEWWIQVSSKK